MHSPPGILNTMNDEEIRIIERLRAELEIGLKQFERGEGVPFTPERYEMIKQRAIENWKSGKSIKMRSGPDLSFPS